MYVDWLFRGSGLVLGLAGLWLIYFFLLADRAKGRKRCPKCWYDMSSADSPRCPECGHDAKLAANLLKTRRRLKGLWLCLLVFLVAGYLWIQPKVKQDGWVSVMPNTALILCLRLEDYRAFISELDTRTIAEYTARYSDPDVPNYYLCDPKSLYQWQWRSIGNTCMDLMKGNPDVSKRETCLGWLYRSSWSVPLEDADRFFQPMISFLTDDDPKIRGMAALYCADGPFSENSVEAIRPLLDDPNRLVRLYAVGGLGLIGQHSTIPHPILVDALRHEYADVRSNAARSLGYDAQYFDDMNVAFEALVNVYRTDSDAQVRANALVAICRFESRREQSYEFIQETFWSTESVTRKAAISLLFSMKQFDEAIDIEFALKGLNDEDASVRSLAARLLEVRVSTESLRPHLELLRAFAKSYDKDVRSAAWHHLRQKQNAVEN